MKDCPPGVVGEWVRAAARFERAIVAVAAELNDLRWTVLETEAKRQMQITMRRAAGLRISEPK